MFILVKTQGKVYFNFTHSKNIGQHQIKSKKQYSSLSVPLLTKKYLNLL